MKWSKVIKELNDQAIDTAEEAETRLNSNDTDSAIPLFCATIVFVGLANALKKGCEQ